MNAGTQQAALWAVPVRRDRAQGPSRCADIRIGPWSCLLCSVAGYSEQLISAGLLLYVEGAV